MQPVIDVCIGPIQLARDTVPADITYIGFRPPCGFPSPAADYETDSLDIATYLIKNKAASFWFEVTGDSMRRIGIFDGDKILVDRSITPRHGHVVLAIVDDVFTVKQLVIEDGVPQLHAANPAYPPILFKDGQEMRVWGVVIGCVKRFMA